MKWRLLLLCLFSASIDAATIYHCQSSTGHAIFSDQPCGVDAKEMDAPESSVVHSNMAVSPQRQKALDQELAQQRHQRNLDRLDNDINAVHQRMDTTRSQRDKSLQSLMDRQLGSSAADRATYRSARQQIERSYRDDMSVLQRQLKALERDRRQAERY